jgi:redox-sensitive bicupin YhaK (pirin superfamily)
MLLKITGGTIYYHDYDWHTGRFHFAFADYENPASTHFGVLQALNEFVLLPGSGFETHPHKEMEIITYCVEGELTHADSLGNSSTLQGGSVQYLCAGSGITHREMNDSPDRTLRFYQIWITPQAGELVPKYRCIHHEQLSTTSSLHHIASGDDLEDGIQIAQEANIYAANLTPGEPLVFFNNQGRQAYLVCLDGKLLVNDLDFSQHDALKVWGEENLKLSTEQDAHLLLVEMAEDF